MRVNQHLMANMVKTEKAIHELDRCGVVITDLNLSGASPTIRVDRAGELARRPAAWSKHTGDGVTRRIERCVIVNDCQVVWQDR